MFLFHNYSMFILYVPTITNTGIKYVNRYSKPTQIPALYFFQFCDFPQLRCFARVDKGEGMRCEQQNNGNNNNEDEMNEIIHSSGA